VFTNSLWSQDPLAIPSNKDLKKSHVAYLKKQIKELQRKIETQEATLKLLKENLSGTLDSDAKLIISSTNKLKKKYKLSSIRYFLGDTEIFTTNKDKNGSPIFDTFVKEGKYKLRIDQRYSPNNTVFTYINDERYQVSVTVPIELKPGQNTHLSLTATLSRNKKAPVNLKYSVSNKAHSTSPSSKIPSSVETHLASKKSS